MSDRYRLRATLVIGREKDGRDKSGRWLIRDRQLKRALRLGDVDRRLAQLLARPRGATLADLQSKLRRSEQEVAARTLAAHAGVARARVVVVAVGVLRAAALVGLVPALVLGARVDGAWHSDASLQHSVSAARV